MQQRTSIDVRNGKEVIIWNLAKDGKLSLKTADDSLIHPSANNNRSLWRYVWKWKGLKRIKTFIWLMVQEKILANETRYIRHMTDNSQCQRCGRNGESFLPAIRDCQASLEV